MEQKRIVEVFKEYINSNDYWEILYSRVQDCYIAITPDDNVFEQFEDEEELAHYILYQFLMDIVYSDEFKVVRKDDTLHPLVINAFWDRVKPYIEALPELEEIAEELIEKETNRAKK